jgi:hypothetical protein
MELKDIFYAFANNFKRLFNTPFLTTTVILHQTFQPLASVSAAEVSRAVKQLKLS